MNTVEALLTSLGFKGSESRTYIALLRLGPSQTGKLCNHLKIPSSYIYKILGNLIEKGVVSYKTKNNIKIFHANHPETLNILYQKKQEQLKQEQENLQKSIKQLKQISPPEHAASDYKYFEGISGIKAIWLEASENMKENTEAIVYTGRTKTFEQLNAFYLEHHKERERKNVSERMIMPIDAKKYGKQREKIGKTQLRYLDLDNEGEFAVFSDFVLLQYASHKVPRGFIIYDQVFAQTFTSIFEKLWKVAEK